MSNSFPVNSATSKLFFLATYSACKGAKPLCLLSISPSIASKALDAAAIFLASPLTFASVNLFSASCLACNAPKYLSASFNWFSDNLTQQIDCNCDPICFAWVVIFHASL